LLDLGDAFESLLPPGAAASACAQDLADAEAYPCERPAVAMAVPARREEFLTARACARAALGKLGCSPTGIPAAPSGAPVWPAGLVGSITHCEGLRAAAVGRRRDLASIGIDAEPNRRLPGGVLDDVAADPERRRLRQLRIEHPHICWDRLLFSVKEALYKCVAPLHGGPWTFFDAEVEFAPQAGTFAATFPRREGQAVPPAEGAWSLFRGVLLAAVAVRAGSQRS
jgi:4'-phosphopantetheinyl transferase EntD